MEKQLLNYLQHCLLNVAYFLVPSKVRNADSRYLTLLIEEGEGHDGAHEYLTLPIEEGEGHDGAHEYLTLLIEEGEGHDGAHAVGDEDHSTVSILHACCLNQALQLTMNRNDMIFLACVVKQLHRKNEQNGDNFKNVSLKKLSCCNEI
jgi:hypothetical protein